MLSGTLLATAGTAIAQGTIEGQVVNRVTGAPLANAAVTLSSACALCTPGVPQFTNDDGRFVFTGLAPRNGS